MKKAVLAFGGFVLAVLLLVVGVVWLSQSATVPAAQQPGLADFEGVDFDTEVGEAAAWAYYPGEWLEPGEFEGREDRPYEEESPTGTYRLRMLLPGDTTFLISFNSIPYACRVFINGELVDTIGRMSANEEDFVPDRYYSHYAARPQQGELELVVQYANHYDGYASPGEVHVGYPRQMMNRQSHADLLRFFVMTLYLAAFILYFGIFLFDIARRENLYFALTCLLMSAREGIIGDEYIKTFFPGLPVDTLFIIQYLGIGILVILQFAFCANLFPGLMSKRGKRIFYFCCLAFLVASYFTRSYVPLLPLLVFLGIGVFIMVYNMVYIFRQIRKLTPNKRLSAIGIVILYLGIFNDMFHLLHVQIGPVGAVGLLQTVMMIFIFIQVIALFLQFMQAERDLGRAREKEAVLAAQNEALQLVDKQRIQFLSDVSHELKTPLTVVSNYAQLTRRHAQDGVVADTYTVEKMLLVASEADRMALMVGQIIDIARLEEGRMKFTFERLNVAELVQRTVDTYYPVLNKNRNRLELDLPGDLPEIWADGDRLEQVLVNLISNAVRFTSRGVITVSARAEGEDLLLTVRDTGVGMDEEQVGHLFQRYYTREGVEGKGTGTGLGLYISNQIVRAHGGEIAVESAPGAGTAMTLRLPVDKAGERGTENDGTDDHSAG